MLKTSILAAFLQAVATIFVFTFLFYILGEGPQGKVSITTLRESAIGYHDGGDALRGQPSDGRKRERHFNLTRARKLIYRRNDSGFGNQSGGMVAAWAVANATGRVFLYDMPMLDHVIDYAAYLGITDEDYQQLLRKTLRSVRSSNTNWVTAIMSIANAGSLEGPMNHFDYQRGKSFVERHATLIQAMLLSEEVKAVSMVCPRVFTCARLGEAVMQRPVTPMDSWEVALSNLMRPSHMRPGFVQTCAARFQGAGLDHDLIRDDCRSIDTSKRKRTLVVLQVQYKVDGGEYKRLILNHLKMRWKHRISRKALAGLKTLASEQLAQTDPSMIEIYITSDDLPFLIEHYDEELSSYGRLLYPRNETFRQTATGDFIPMCDWYILGNADYALVSGTSFSYSAMLRCSHSLQAFNFLQNNLRFDKSTGRW